MVWKPSFRIGLSGIATILSAFALLLSYQSFRYLNIDVREDLVANVLACSFATFEEAAGYETTIAVANGGNRTAAITGLSVTLEGPGQIGSSGVTTYGFDAVAVAPGDVLLLRPVFGIDKTVVGQLGPDRERVRATLTVSVVDHESVYHEVSSPLGSFVLREVILAALDLPPVPNAIQLLPSPAAKPRQPSFVASMDSTAVGRMIYMTQDGPDVRPPVPDSSLAN